MNEIEVTPTVAVVTSLLLIVSELLGVSNCKANSIIQVYKFFMKLPLAGQKDDCHRCSNCLKKQQEEEEEVEEEEEEYIHN